jgi:hypothetical protein
LGEERKGKENRKEKEIKRSNSSEPSSKQINK